MIFSSLIKKKADLTTLPETATLQEALTVLENTGYRCVTRDLVSGKFSVVISTKCTFTVTSHEMAI